MPDNRHGPLCAVASLLAGWQPAPKRRLIGRRSVRSGCAGSKAHVWLFTQSCSLRGPCQQQLKCSHRAATPEAGFDGGPDCMYACLSLPQLHHGIWLDVFAVTCACLRQLIAGTWIVYSGAVPWPDRDRQALLARLRVSRCHRQKGARERQFCPRFTSKSGAVDCCLASCGFRTRQPRCWCDLTIWHSAHAGFYRRPRAPLPVSRSQYFKLAEHI